MSDKQLVRDRAWAAIRAAGAARFPGVEGRIPNFIGAERAAEMLADTPEWAAASHIKANPDAPQFPVRKRALADGKTVYMAVPKLASDHPFWRLDPDELGVSPHQAASIKGAGQHGVPVSLHEMERIDLVVCGSVAVETSGARLGKGGGYSDLEYAIAVEAGLIGDWTTLVTTVHECQVLEDGAVPLTDHDFPVDMIVLADRAIRTSTRLPRPGGVLDDHLDADKRASIPVLAHRPTGRDR
jgi:5-formyltetrahydrofolate cyclo-ligase